MKTLKSIRAHVEWKANTPGAFRATFARLDSGPDKEGDVYIGPEAFPTGKAIVVSAYMHTSWAGALPVGKGVIGADEKAAWIDGEFFVDTASGLETYKVVKALADSGLGEWSYGYDVLSGSTDAKDLESYGEGAKRLLKELDIFEVSPVLVGAGNLTSTDSIKARRFSAAVKQMSLDSNAIAAIAQIDALTDDLDDAVDALMATLGIPDPDEMVVGSGDGNADNNPQMAAAAMPRGVTLAAQSQEAPVALLSLVSRYKALAAMRAKEGRVLSTANRDRLTALADALNGALADIGELLAATEPEGGKSADAGEGVANAVLEFEAFRATLIAQDLI